MINLVKALGVEPEVLVDAPVKKCNTIDIQEILRDKDVELLFGGKRLLANDRHNVMELISLFCKLVDDY